MKNAKMKRKKERKNKTKQKTKNKKQKTKKAKTNEKLHYAEKPAYMLHTAMLKRTDESVCHTKRRGKGGANTGSDKQKDRRLRVETRARDSE